MACELLCELRPAFSRQSMMAAVGEARAAGGYQLAGVFDESGELLCVAGFVIGFKLAWGRHLYVDDLVTTQARRSRGAGKRGK